MKDESRRKGTQIPNSEDDTVQTNKMMDLALGPGMGCSRSGDGK